MATHLDARHYGTSTSHQAWPQILIARQIEQIGRLRERNPRVARTLCEQLLNQLKPTTDHLLWAMAQMAYAHILLYSSQMKNVVKVCKQAEPIIEQLDNRGNHLRCMLYAAMGAAYAFLGQFEPSLNYSQKLVDFARRIQDRRELCRAYLNMGTVHSLAELYSDALTFFSLALHLAEELGEKIVEATTLDNMGIIYRNLEHTELALLYFTRAYHIRTELGSMPGIAQSLLNIASIHYLHRDFEQVLVNVRKAYRLAQECGIHSIEAQSLSLLGWVYLFHGKPKRALSLFQRARKTWLKVDPASIGYPAILEGITRTLLVLGRSRAAEKLLRQIIEYARTHDTPSHAAWCTETLYELAKARGNTKEALYWYEQHHQWYTRSIERFQIQKLSHQLLLETMARLRREHEQYRAMLIELGTTIETQRQEIARLSIELASRSIHPFWQQTMAALCTNSSPEQEPNDKSATKMQRILEKMEHVLPGYIGTLRGKAPHLTPTELLICILLRLLFRTKEIAQMLDIAPSTVYRHRENIRHKCGLDPTANLITFLCNIA
ncbi:MAG: hypothetical protein KatS3mg039_0124 [Candidatus Kapaibacterium sp.]|nr:MAG: hypothetical protein KatS3mg039_0124 [Candidatus Kapabacteria bacterium]